MANFAVIIPWLRKREGGLSNARTDAASKHPVPDTATGRYASNNGKGFHTNKGVTWKTFQDMAGQLGYKATADLFYQMPAAIWGAIYKIGYWDAIKGDQVKSQPVADLLVNFAYNAGPGTAGKALQRVLNSMGQSLQVDGIVGKQTVAATNQANERKLLEQLRNGMEAYYRALGKKPTYAANLSEWLNRLNELYELKKKTLPQPESELAPAC